MPPTSIPRCRRGLSAIRASICTSPDLSLLAQPGRALLRPDHRGPHPLRRVQERCRTGGSNPAIPRPAQRRSQALRLDGFRCLYPGEGGAWATNVRVTTLANVQQATIKPIIEANVSKGSLIHTDEYDIYARLAVWGYQHKTVCHAHGEYARDEDGDGFCEVHVNTMEGFWSLLRSWLRPHRGISQDKLPDYLGFFQCVHNARRRGKALLSALIATLVT